MADQTFLDYLEMIRAYELECVLPLLSKDGTILELGAGMGYQAKILSERGYQVVALDVAESGYLAHRVYDVVVYDGRHIPLPSRSIHCVFSSHVLEHIRDLPQVHAELRRVLQPGGYAVHVMPTAVWRFYSWILRLFNIPARWSWVIRQKRGLLWTALRLARVTAGQLWLMPQRHGERGNFVSEHWLFSVVAWRKHFQQHGWRVRQVTPLRLFYTGIPVCGMRLSIQRRQQLARCLGSVAVAYVVSPGY